MKSFSGLSCAVLAGLCFLAFPFSLLAGTVAATWGALKKGENPRTDNVMLLEQVIVSGDTVSLTLSNGEIISPDKYEELVAAGMLHFSDEVRLVVSGDTAQEVPAAGDGKPIRIGNVVITFIPSHSHHLAGCINRIVPHVGVQVREVKMVGGVEVGDRLLFNLHLAKWNEGGGKICFGIYITKDDPAKPWRTMEVFCWKGCIGFEVMNPRQLRDKLVQGFINAGVPFAFAVPLMVITFPLLLAL